jgi:transposase
MPVRTYDQKQTYLFPPCLDEWLDEDHPARIFSELIDHIDLTGLCEIKATGCPRFPPNMMTKVLLWGYATGVRASRKIEECLHSNVIFMWLAGRLKPDFRTICDFRRCNKDALDRIFAQVVVMARELGMAKLGLVALDGTKIRASAGIGSFKKLKAWRAELAEAKELVAAIMAEAEALDQKDEAQLADSQSTVRLPLELATAERRIAKIQALLNQIPPDFDEETRISSTDPDARFMHTAIGSMPAYNAELVVTPDQVIVSAHVTTEPVDQNQLAPGLARTEQICGERPTQVVADTGFNQGNNLKVMEKLGIDGYIPESGERNIGKDLRRNPELFSKAEFRYDAEQDTCQCPAGKTLRPTSKQRTQTKYAQREGIVYRTERGTCLSCPLKQQCTKSMNPDGRSVTRDDYEMERTRMRARLDTVEGRAIYGKRKKIAEPTIGQLKVVGGIRQFLLRGIRKVGIEWLWSTIGHSLLKITRRVADGTVKLAWAS